MKTDHSTFPHLIEFLNRLREAGIHFTLASYRDEAVMVQTAVPGERWEVEFLLDGKIEIERFRSSGEIFDEKELEVLFKEFSDAQSQSQRDIRKITLRVIPGNPSSNRF
jgi:hypothetical protein